MLPTILVVKEKEQGRAADGRAGRPAGALPIDAPTRALLRGSLTQIADQVVVAIIDEVPSYRRPFRGTMGRRIGEAVELALDYFLTAAAQDADPSVPIAKASSAAYELGRGEARTGRSMDALLAAYRIGARVSWRELSRVAISGGMSAPVVGRFAELVFAYIDALSAASISGHTDELETTGRVRERHLGRLARLLITGADEATLDAAAERVAWDPPTSLTALLLVSDAGPRIAARLDPRTLHVTGDLPDLDDDVATLLVPDLTPARRDRLVASLEGEEGALGPTRPWPAARASYERARRGLRLARADHGVVDTDERLVDLVLLADEDALRDLRERVLSPLAGLRPAQRARLEETLRAWLLHRGARDRVAAALYVHPHTVRYRLGQLRSVFGARLDDPDTHLALTLALGVVPPPPETGGEVSHRREAPPV